MAWVGGAGRGGGEVRSRFPKKLSLRTDRAQGGGCRGHTGEKSSLFLILGLRGSPNLSPKGSGGDRTRATRAAASQKPVRDS